ncbi:hypothetical protein ABT084_33210 [Streptomyces sp. NPDC002138]|uniref:hypothetical protein n=1 Tax=Streptomyces sp. NPDC002138 TaxID=3154410 RepID=UPI0033194C28
MTNRAATHGAATHSADTRTPVGNLPAPQRGWGPRRTAFARAAFVAGPLCMGAYGVVRLANPEHRPDLAWTAGHLVMLVGVALFGAVFPGLRRLTEPVTGAARWSARTATALGLAGTLAVIAQAAIDIAVGLRAADRPEMHRLFDQVQSHPGVMPAVYTVVPLFFYVGLIWLVVQLAVQRRIALWRPVAVVLGTAVSAVSLDLIPLGALLFCAALSPLARDLATAVRPGQRTGGA